MLPSITVTVIVNAAVHDFIRGQSFDELVVGIDQAADPFVRFDVLDVTQNFFAQLFASLESAHDFLVVGDALVLAVDKLQAVEEIDGCHR